MHTSTAHSISAKCAVYCSHSSGSSVQDVLTAKIQEKVLEETEEVLKRKHDVHADRVRMLEAELEREKSDLAAAKAELDAATEKKETNQRTVADLRVRDDHSYGYILDDF